MVRPLQASRTFASYAALSAYPTVLCPIEDIIAVTHSCFLDSYSAEVIEPVPGPDIDPMHMTTPKSTAGTINTHLNQPPPVLAGGGSYSGLGGS